MKNVLNSYNGNYASINPASKNVGLIANAGRVFGGFAAQPKYIRTMYFGAGLIVGPRYFLLIKGASGNSIFAMIARHFRAEGGVYAV